MRRNVADYFVMKILPRKQTGDKLKECKKLADCNYLAKLYHTFQSKDKLFLIVEYIKGIDLATLLREFGRIEEKVIDVELSLMCRTAGDIWAN